MKPLQDGPDNSTETIIDNSINLADFKSYDSVLTEFKKWKQQTPNRCQVENLSSASSYMGKRSLGKLIKMLAKMSGSLELSEVDFDQDDLRSYLKVIKFIDKANTASGRKKPTKKTLEFLKLTPYEKQLRSVNSRLQARDFDERRQKILGFVLAAHIKRESDQAIAADLNDKDFKTTRGQQFKSVTIAREREYFIDLYNRVNFSSIDYLESSKQYGETLMQSSSKKDNQPIPSRLDLSEFPLLKLDAPSKMPDLLFAEFYNQHNALVDRLRITGEMIEGPRIIIDLLKHSVLPAGRYRMYLKVVGLRNGKECLLPFEAEHQDDYINSYLFKFGEDQINSLVEFMAQPKRRENLNNESIALRNRYFISEVRSLTD